MIKVNDMFYAQSNDIKIKEAGECGGAVTTILKFLLKEQIVEAVLTVRSRADIYDVVPVLIKDPKEIILSAGSLHFGTLNLANVIVKYINTPNTKIAVTVKPCEAMSIVELIKREKIKEDNIILIGLNCGGTMPPVKSRRMIKQIYEFDPTFVVKEEIDKGKFIVETKDGTQKKILIDHLEEKGFGRRSNCRRCEINIPKMVDIVCGNWGVLGHNRKTTFIEVLSARGAAIIEKAQEKKVINLETPIPNGIKIRANTDNIMAKIAYKWQNNDWNNLEGREILSALKEYMLEFDRCIKCYGCREVCPLCYCDNCCLEANTGPDWLTHGQIPPSPMFHLERMLHMVESCTNCGQCEDVCPSEIPLAKIWHEVNTKIRSKFGYNKGINKTKPPIAYSTPKIH